MKTKCISFKLLILLSSALALTTAFGQSTVTWTGGDGTGTQIGAATNWGGTLPIFCLGDTGQWDGVVPGNLSLIYDYPGYVSSFCQYGGNFLMTGSQSGSVNISTTLSASPNLTFWTLVNNSGNASFSLGNSTANILNVIWRPSNANELHVLENNSASPNIIYPNVRIQSGGGVNHVLFFQGTGDWRLTNNLICANVAPTSIHKSGSGTLYWNGPSIPAAMGNATISSPITIAGGTLVLQNNTVLSPLGLGNVGSQAIENNGTLFKYDAPSLAMTLSGVISGTGALQVSSGTLTLTGTNTYNGGTSISGGTLQVGANGTSGSIGSGNVTNDSYLIFNRSDYVTFGNGISGTGSLVQQGSGTLTLSGASSYSGATTVSAGKLVVQGAKSGTGNITVADGAALGVAAGTPVTPTTLTMGSSSGATLEFNNVTSTTTVPLAANTLAAAGTTTINVNSGTFALGQSYPLLTWNSGSAPTVALGSLSGAVGNLTTNGNTIQLSILALARIWSGGDGTGTQVGAATNWGGTLPSTANGDTGQWDGVVPGNLFLTYNGGLSSGFGQSGITFGLTPNQTGSVNIASPVAASPNLAILNLANDSANASFSLGNGGANVLNVIWRPGDVDQVHNLVNNSTSANIIYPNVRFQSGGGAVHILSFGGTGDWRLTNNMINAGSVSPLIQKTGSGTLYWNGPSIPGALGNGTISSPITIAGGMLVLQNNTVLAPSGAGNKASQNIINNGVLQYDAPSRSLTLSGVISGAGQLQVSSGTLILTGTNTYAGKTEITNNGTLVVRSVGGDLNVRGGTLVSVGVGSIGTLDVAGNFNISAGTVSVSLNKSLSPSNSLVSVADAISSSGGTLKLLNFGPSLTVGDKFTLFNQPVSGGASMTMVSPGFAVANNLAADGSVTVTSVEAAETAQITPTVSGGQLNLAWPSAYTGLSLQIQTNPLTAGLGTNWITIQGTDGGNNYSNILNNANGSVFFRLAP